MLIKGFDKLLKLLVRASWIAAGYANCAEKQYKQFINNDKVYSSMKSFAMNERIYYSNLGLLTKFPSSTGDRKGVVKLFCHMEMFVRNRYFQNMENERCL